MAALTKAHASAGNLDAARVLIRELLERSEKEYIPPFSMVHAYAAVGDVDEALAWLEAVFEERSNAVVYLMTDPNVAPTRSDPRFHLLFERAGLGLR